MTLAELTRIDGPYGAERIATPEPIAPGVSAASSVAPDTRVVLDDDLVAQDAGFKQARAAREARALRPDPTILESLGAAVSQWDTTKLIARIGRPSFDDDSPINAAEYLDHVPLVLTKDERDYFIDVAKGTKSADYAMEQIKDKRMATSVVGDHPIAGLAGAFADPLWLVVPPAIRIGKLAGPAGRLAAGATGAGLAGAVTALGEGPVSDEEITMSMLMNGAAAAALFKNGKLVQADPEFPLQRLNDTLKPRYKLHVDGTIEKLADTPVHATPASSAADVERQVEAAVTTESKKQGLGETLQWNMRKTMSAYSDAGKRISNLLYDNNSDLSITSTEAHYEAIKSELRGHQIVYEDLLRTAVRDDGFGLLKTIFKPRDAYAAQRNIEVQLQQELFRREQSARVGQVIPSNAPERIVKMADALDAVHKRALQELKTAGVTGAEDLLERPGYLNRRWSSGAMDKAFDRLEAMGLTRDKARAKVTDLVTFAVRRGNAGMDLDVAETIGRSIVDRAMRRGYFEDGDFNGFADAAKQAQVRDVLKGGKADQALIDRVMQTITSMDDEAGKAGFLKHRMDLDYKASMRIGNETFSISDLIDNNVTSIVDQYIARVSTQAAFARNGLKARSDIDALRRELSQSIPDEAKRKEAVQLFDNTMAHFRGEPAGATLNDKFRLAQVYGRSITLAWSGLWQATEFATAMGEYGLSKTLKYAVQEIPGFKSVLADKASADSLNVILADHSVASLRLRPYLSRYADGYDLDTGNALQLSAQMVGQTVPYANAMKFVHHKQAQIVGNLILDRVRLATKGNQDAIAALKSYGIEAPVMDKLRTEIATHGFHVDAWDDKVWEATRPAFAKMMDAAVLRTRLGDTPAFAQFDSAGKLLFTYRTFVLTAHNKVLAGMLERNGAGAVGLILLYQLPLSMLAVQAQASINGEGTLAPDALAKRALGQMGGLGLFSEPLKWASGESNSVGAPFLIPVDRGVKLLQAGVQMDPQKLGGTALTMLPTISAIPFVKGMAQQIKE